MSRGHCQPRNHPGRRTLERCKSKGTVANVEIIDVDKGKSDVVIIDVPESSHQESRCFRSKTRDCCPNVISIDDEEEGIDGAPSNARYAATSSAFCPLSSNSPFFEEFDGDECLMFVGKGAFQSKLTVEVKVHAKCGYPRSRYGPDPASNSGTSGSDNSEFYTSEGDSSEGNCSDCEIMEDASGEIREQWERAALRKKMLQRSQFVSEDQASASGSSADPGYQADEAIQNMVNIESINESDEAYSKHFEEVPGECGPSSSSNGKNSSSRMVNADEFTEDSLWGGKGNNSIANSDPSTGVSHYGPVFQNDELISEECSHRALPSDETCFNHKKDCFQDFEMEDSIQIRDEGFSFRDKDEQVPVETCYCTAEQVPVETCHCTAELRGETIFQDAESPCPGIPHKAWAGNTLFSDSVCFQEKKEPGLEEQPSCHNQSPLDSVVNHEIAAREKEDKEENSPEEQLCQTRSPCDSVHELAAQVKEKSHGEQTILFNYQPTNKQQNDVGNQSCQSKEGTSEELIFKPNEESGATESCPLYMESDLSHIQNDLIGAREKHKESDEYKRVEEEEWASRQQELQTQV
ncbi:hypothetical protein COCNU_scaffold001144G000010 [Cocos nucifera]|nr:hypothetical protein [Cocos nucifera]